jgi:putative flippase GtrA
MALPAATEDPPPTAAHWILRGGWRVLTKELGAFGVVGGVGFVLDLAVFQLLITRTEVGAVTAKLIAATLSSTTAFLGHRFWSFSHRSHGVLHRDYVRFAVVNGVTLLLSLSIVALVRYPLGQEGALVLQAANVTSIVIGTAIRFLVYRAWVFPARSEDGAVEPPRIPA